MRRAYCGLVLHRHLSSGPGKYNARYLASRQDKKPNSAANEISEFGPPGSGDAFVQIYSGRTMVGGRQPAILGHFPGCDTTYLQMEKIKKY